MRSIKEMMDLTDRQVLVTGGLGYLGHAISEVLLELGADVHVITRGVSDKFPIVDPRHRLKVNTCVDVTLQSDVDDIMDIFDKRLGSFDILVNNMCSWPKHVDFLTASWGEIDEHLGSNLTGQLYLTKRVAARMQRGGKIINIGSMYGKVSPDLSMYRGEGGNALEYGAAKAALIQATKYLASLLGRRGICVNSISPGPFPRPGALDGKDWFAAELENRTMLGRVAKSEELKGVVALLATDLGSYITGEDIAVDGGWTAW